MQKKLILVDGNNLMFRSYYATAYSGRMMKNSKGLPTNALFGFASMINKIIAEENPTYMAVAFDIGLNFRKSKYDFYKEGRTKTPDELNEQMPIARDMLDCLGIKHFELAPYEADDIIGTIAKMTEIDPDFASVIVSSDKDLLQLISHETEVKLLKQTGFIRYNYDTFKEDYKIEPIRIIDLKALMGDSSDNIPGVPGVGEKTALKLLQEYGSLDNLYANLDKITGKVKEKLEMGKESAYMSKDIATIYRDVPLDITLEDLKLDLSDDTKIKEMYQELEFFSLLKSDIKPKNADELSYKVIEELDELKLADDVAIYLELDNANYHIANIIGMSITDKDNNYFIKKELVKDALEFIKNKNITTYDLKKVIGNTKIPVNGTFDVSIAAYILGLNSKDDVAYLANQFDRNIMFYDALKKNNFTDIVEIVKKSKFLYDIKDEFIKRMTDEGSYKLFTDIEMPLVPVLADMEITGIKVDKQVLDEMKKEIDVKIELLEDSIYNLAGRKFNISSPKQLGEVLFVDLGLPSGKKNKTGYSTDVKVLEKLAANYPIAEKILEYRALTKLNSTYIEGLENYILEDGKIHTIYKQTLTRTGRLSSTEPNLQNIPVREEMGRKIRKAFVPVNDLLLSADYSQIELRILAHISKCPGLIDAFKNDFDIHTKVASDIYGIPTSGVTKTMRRTAKAVIFGIVYGISGFGLGENLHISRSDADEFIKKYFELYPEVKKYTEDVVKYAHEHGFVTTLFGRKRIIDEIKNPNYIIKSTGERMAMNTPIQGTSADIMKMAMINVYNRFKKEGITSKILLQVHDEIIVDVKGEELEKVKRIIKEEMENVYKLDVPLKVEIDTGINWYEAK